MSIRNVLVSALVALIALAGSPARAETTLGIEALLVNGKHAVQAGSIPISGAAGLIELRQRWRSFDLAIEGIPPVGGRGYLVVPNGFVRPITNVSLFSASSHVRIGRAGRFWVGGGIIVINQITSLGSPPIAAASRVTGGRYEALAFLPSGRRGELELRAALMPSLQGKISYQLGGFSALPPNSERAEATDLTAEYLFHYRSVAFGAGVRSINYVANFVSPASLADRNTSFGPLLEVRFTLAK